MLGFLKAWIYKRSSEALALSILSDDLGSGGTFLCYSLLTSFNFDRRDRYLVDLMDWGLAGVLFFFSIVEFCFYTPLFGGGECARR